MSPSGLAAACLYYFRIVATFFPQTLQQPLLSPYLVKLHVPATRQVLTPPVAIVVVAGGRDIVVEPPDVVLAVWTGA